MKLKSLLAVTVQIASLAPPDLHARRNLDGDETVFSLHRMSCGLELDRDASDAVPLGSRVAAWVAPLQLC